MPKVAVATDSAAGMPEAEQQVRRVVGHAALAKLAVAVERELALHQPNREPIEATDALMTA